MSSWSWKEGFVFAFAGKLLSSEKNDKGYKMSFSEKLGSYILIPLYLFIEFISKNIKVPLAICLFTILSVFFLGLIFYSIPIFLIFQNLFPTWLARVLLFIWIELNFFAMGCRAFGRFNNKALVNSWKNGRLIALMPGDYKTQK